MIFIYGYGYTSQHLCKLLISNKIIATSRNCEKKKSINDNIELIAPSETNLIIKEYSDKITHLLISVPPSDDGDLFLNNFNKDLQSLKNLKWVGYLSATSVYGDHKGEFVNENSELLTKFTRGINRKLAEDQWIDISNKYNLPLHIFRIAGIYGPQRSMIDRMSSGNFINVIKDNHFFSRIYIDDLVNIINASMNKPNPISIYNVADDLPSPLNDVVRYISEKTGIIIDREVQYSELSEDEKRESFFTENKKVNNKLIKEELGVILKYPTYIEGYNKIINC